MPFLPRHTLPFIGLVLLLATASAEPPQADPAQAAKDPDFLVQGEYAGVRKGMQVIALGDGEFDMVVYEGGLPGAGWDRAEPRRLDGDSDTVLDLVDSMKLKRVERESTTLGAKPPSGAMVLFDGSEGSLANWEGGKRSDSGLLMPGTSSKQTFDDYTLHLEFRTPYLPTKRGQARGNSGVYHQGRYETQILDSFGLSGAMNETGGIYSIAAPQMNVCYPPLTWQTYDVDFTAARYDNQKKKITEPTITVRLNGVIVHNAVKLTHATTAAKLGEGPGPGPIYLQDHGNEVRYRNIWILPRDVEREAARPIVPGFERFFAGNPNAAADGGHVLISSLACNACHAGGIDAIPGKRGPDLTAVRSRVRGDALVAMIANPHQTKTGTTMPDPWVGADETTRQQNATAIASYLTLRGKGEFVDRPTRNKNADRGAELYHSIGCTACHSPLNNFAKPSASLPLATTVPLGDVAKKYSTVALSRFLQKPHDVRPGLRMPALVGSESDAFAIASFLTRSVTERRNTSKFSRKVYRGQWQQLPDFDSLTPVQTDTVRGLKINDIKPANDYGVVFMADIRIEKAGKYRFRINSDDGSRLIIGKNRLENDGIHAPQAREATFELTEGIHPIRIEFFNGGGGAEVDAQIFDPVFGRVDIEEMIVDPDQPAEPSLLPSRFSADESMADTGARLFRSAGCVQCHGFGDDKTNEAFAPALDVARAGQGCLADTVAAPAVDYGLTSLQRSAIEAAMVDLTRKVKRSPQDVDQQRVHLTMAALNCYACHRRGDVGGPEPSREAMFKTQIPEMGLEGQLPPPLTGVADKLNDEYLTELFNKGANERPYMLTRMPGYRHEPLADFHQSLVRLDRDDSKPTVDNSDTHNEIVAAGRQAVGNRGLACIKCHAYNGDKGGGIGAIDLLAMPRRLRESWFHRYLKDPLVYRPGTRMPNSFVDGRSALTKLYDGDPAKQIDAMWQYLKEGTEAKEPEGLKEGAILLAADARPRIYRNFFTDISARGIGVGYPGDVNLIWDAEQMTLAKIWKNSFIDAAMHWQGRGQGRQQPMGDDVVDIEKQTPFALLPSLNSPWPKESGRDRGYRFKGYRLDADGNPAFGYRFGNVTVTESIKPFEPTIGKGASGFSREITIERNDPSSDESLVWLIGSGKVVEGDGGYRVNSHGVAVVSDNDAVQPQIIQVGSDQQLRAIIPNQATVTIREVILW
ncbi:family 16 glycoside hydrolase [Stieleria varia]|nr:family 16 glycoside hydrolase [Stieleria varia]